MNNKRGWIRIVEAFVAILLIMGVVLLVINKGYVGRDDLSLEIYEEQTALLREIQLNDITRIDLLTADNEDPGTILPITWDDSNFPPSVKNRINQRFQGTLICEAKICELDRVCVLDTAPETDVYAQSIAISATSGTYSPRQLKMFCWTEE